MLNINPKKNRDIDVLDEYEEISHHFDEENIKKEDIPTVSLMLDKFVLTVGNVLSWLSLVLIFIIMAQVISRYAFNANFIALEELQWHLYAVVMMVGLSYAMVNHSHVRVDIFRAGFSEKTQRKIETLGILFLMLPFIYIVIDYGLDLAIEAYRVGERSDAIEGLPHRWIIKAVMPLSFFLLFLAAMARYIRYAKYLLKELTGGN